MLNLTQTHHKPPSPLVVAVAGEEAPNSSRGREGSRATRGYAMRVGEVAADCCLT
jgi:hypothetical protein